MVRMMIKPCMRDGLQQLSARNNSPLIGPNPHYGLGFGTKLIVDGEEHDDKAMYEGW